MESHEPQPFHWHYSQFEDNNFQIHGRTLFFIIVLLGLTLSIILLYIFARWVCLSRTAMAIQLPHAPPQQNLSCQGLDSNRINRLPVVLHRASSAGSETECCSICLGNFQDGEKVKELPDCHHFYHSECVDKWLTNQSSCPLCRASLGVVSLV